MLNIVTATLADGTVAFAGFDIPGPGGETVILVYDSAALAVTFLLDVETGGQATPRIQQTNEAGLFCTPAEAVAQIAALRLAVPDQFAAALAALTGAA